MMATEGASCYPEVIMNGFRFAAAVTGLAALTAMSTAAQHFPMALTGAWLTGPRGNAEIQSAFVGERVNLHIGIWNLSAYGDSVTVTEVSLIIHHGSGDVVISNMLTSPALLEHWGTRAMFSTNFFAQADDPDNLEVEYSVTGYYNFDDPGFFGSSSAFTTRFGCQIQIVKPPPTLSIGRDGTGSVFIQWSLSASNYQLQRSGDSGRTWSGVTMPPVVLDANYRVTLSASDDTCTFFRLEKP